MAVLATVLAAALLCLSQTTSHWAVNPYHAAAVQQDVAEVVEGMGPEAEA